MIPNTEKRNEERFNHWKETGELEEQDEPCLAITPWETIRRLHTLEEWQEMKETLNMLKLP